MKKLKSTLPNMVIVLTSIAVIAGLALGYVNSITAEPIKQIKEKTEKAAIDSVMCTNAVEVLDTMKVLEKDQKDTTYVYKTSKGVAVKVTDPNGFGGKLTVLVGFNDEGLIQGYQVLETSETPGLGAKAGEWFQKGQKGDIIGKQAGNLSVSKDGGEVDAITASTITSRAFLRCVNAAYEALNSQKEDAQTGASVQNKEEKEVSNE